MSPHDDIVGHKTIATGRGGPFGPELRHEPLLRSEAAALIAESDRQKERRAANMPNEQAALAVLFDAWQRLNELGWRNAIYCPKDGTVFDAIEIGSTGIHECSYQGEWPTGSWWIHADGDLFPSRPILFRLKPAPPSPARARVQQREDHTRELVAAAYLVLDRAERFRQATHAITSALKPEDRYLIEGLDQLRAALVGDDPRPA